MGRLRRLRMLGRVALRATGGRGGPRPSQRREKDERKAHVPPRRVHRKGGLSRRRTHSQTYEPDTITILPRTGSQSQTFFLQFVFHRTSAKIPAPITRSTNRTLTAASGQELGSQAPADGHCRNVYGHSEAHVILLGAAANRRSILYATSPSIGTGLGAVISFCT